MLQKFATHAHVGIRNFIIYLLLGALLSIASVTSVGTVWADEFSDIGPVNLLFKIDEIKIKGIKKVEQEAIMERISLRVGMRLDNYALDKDIKKIYGMKYFEFVEAHHKKVRGKNRLVFVVKEKPIIKKIEIIGNYDLDRDDLVGQIKTKEFSILDINTIKSDVSALQKFYEEKGYYLASVDYEVKRVDQENIELKFNIREFDKVKVKKIIFLGNRAFEDKQLKDIMETREENVFSFMSSAGNFKEFNFGRDIELLKYFYKTKGYLQINVGSPQITVSEDKKWVFITVKLVEGPRFSVNDISFRGEVQFPDSEMLEKISIKKDKEYSEEKLRRDIQLLTELYQDKGYAFVNVLRTLHIVPGENKVDVEFSFEKGKIAHFGKILIKGNNKTRDKVIRRELKIKEGAMFNGTSLRRSKENVNRLGYFEPNSVVFHSVSPKGKDDVLNVEISVKERNTGQISMGAGYSSQTHGFLDASIAQKNFLGLGQELSFHLNLSKTNTRLTLKFTEPYLFDTKWTAGSEVYYQRDTSRSEYHLMRRGIAPLVGYPIMDYTRLYLTYKLEESKKSNVDPDIDIDVEADNGVASSIKATIVRDKRDNSWEPRNGYFLSLGAEYVGVTIPVLDIGRDKRWFLAQMDGRYYHNLWGDFVLRSRLNINKLSTIGVKRIPDDEKLYLGGARSLRGYYFRSIGPKREIMDDNGVVRSISKGGLFSVLTTVELEHPLAREAGLKWVLFVDAGNVYENKFGEIRKVMTEGGGIITKKNYRIYADYGFGFRWFSPIGVLRFEFGYPMGSDQNRGMQFYFDIGQIF